MLIFVLSVYPWGTLPILEVDGKVLGQSQAILRYLGKQFKLAGENDFEEAKCDEMVEAMNDMRKGLFIPKLLENTVEDLK